MVLSDGLFSSQIISSRVTLSKSMVDRLIIFTESLLQKDCGWRISNAGRGLVPLTLKDWVMESTHPLLFTMSCT